MNYLRELAFAGAWLVSAAATCLATVALADTYAVQVIEARLRAQMHADTLAQRLSSALAHGGTLSAAQAAKALITNRLAQWPELVAVGVTLTGQRDTWQYAAGADASIAQSSSIEAPVALSGIAVGSVRVAWSPPSIKALIVAWAPPLLAWLAMVVLLSGWTLRRAWVRGPGRRDLIVESASHQILQGNYRWRLLSEPRRAHDLRARTLATDLQHINELHRQVTRLASSLRQTEPDGVRRAELDAILQQATAGEQFLADSQTRGAIGAEPANGAWRPGWRWLLPTGAVVAACLVLTLALGWGALDIFEWAAAYPVAPLAIALVGACAFARGWGARMRRHPDSACDVRRCDDAA